MYKLFVYLSSHTQPTKNTKILYSTHLITMPKTPAKRKNTNGKLTDEGAPCEASFAHSAKLSKLPEVPLVVTPEAALCACALTLSIDKFSLRLLSTKSTNLSSKFAAKSTTAITTNSFSVVKMKAEYINFCDSKQVKAECLKYLKTPLICQKIKKLRFHSLLGNLTQAV